MQKTSLNIAGITPQIVDFDVCEVVNMVVAQWDSFVSFISTSMNKIILWIK